MELGQSPLHNTEGSPRLEPTGETSAESGPGRNTDGAEEGETINHGEGDGTLYVVNLSGAEVWSAHIGRCSGGGWSDDLFGVSTMPHGCYFTITGIDRGCYDILAYDSELAASGGGGTYWAFAGADVDPEFTLILAPPYSTGDDDEDGCDDMEVRDCNDSCAPSDFLGDGQCDDGTGDPADFDCDDHDYDNGDCSEVGDDDDGPAPGGTVELVNDSAYPIVQSELVGSESYGGACGRLEPGDSCFIKVVADDAYTAIGVDEADCEHWTEAAFVAGGDSALLSFNDNDVYCP